MPDRVGGGSEDAPMPDISAVEDTSEAQWLVAGLDPSWKTVGGLVPGGFEAYARILHPAWRVRREGDRLVRSPVRWAEVATLRGTVAHRLMQWPQVWALPLFDDAAIAACADAGLRRDAPPDAVIAVRRDLASAPRRVLWPALSVQIRRPVVHQAAALEHRRPRIRRFGLVGHHVRQRGLDNLGGWFMSGASRKHKQRFSPATIIQIYGPE